MNTHDSSQIPALYKALHVFQSSLDLAEVLQRVLDSALELTNGELGIIMLCDDGCRTLRLSPDMNPKTARGQTAEMVYGLTREAAETEQSILVTDTRDEPRFAANEWLEQFVLPAKYVDYIGRAYAEVEWSIPRTILVVPLRAQGESLGALYVDRSHARPFASHELDLLEAFLDFAANAVQNAQLYQEAQSIGLNGMLALQTELLSPLTFIQGCTELLRGEDAGPINDKQRELLTLIRMRTEMATKTVNAFATTARIATGTLRMVIEEMDLVTCVKKAVTRLRHEIEKKGQTLTIQLSMLPSVWADERRVVEVLNSLLENAHMYTPTEGQIMLTAEVHGEFVKVTVTDTGIGIAEADQPRLFSSYFRGVDPVVREQAGVGMDLYFAKYIIERLGGEIGFTSELGKGSTFWFTVPIAAENRHSDSPGNDMSETRHSQS